MIGRRTCLLLSLVGLPIGASIARAQSGQPAPSRLALKGYDPVAYFTDGKPMPGNPQYETTYDGTRYRFASAQHLELFKADPDRYAPQFAGSCAAGIAMGVKVESDPEDWLIVDGKRVDISDQVELDEAKIRNMDAVVDRFAVSRKHEKAVKAAIAAALLVGDGLIQIQIVADSHALQPFADEVLGGERIGDVERKIAHAAER